jgi:hypothetical protein
VVVTAFMEAFRGPDGDATLWERAPPIEGTPTTTARHDAAPTRAGGVDEPARTEPVIDREPFEMGCLWGVPQIAPVVVACLTAARARWDWKRRSRDSVVGQRFNASRFGVVEAAGG